ncbi:Uncharacterised protein [Mycobacteroides abscessus subsp. bolletii]|uniref:Uncharacterized protein n=1 Tax=Mycobacteroides abscessus subsp. bolletii TaxID=319705 RepID=A0A9Q7SEC8_9MYCO|nr:Uncharacterised protein [Mycobacteroides abscessus]SHP34613.1 Uncharacterised protein [Mycobacteroides abscessus subsp. bolletii]SHR25626.1 Uncharacterised protein [Mycobacteroides abscessus subsp. bolletii]SHR72405.1 Uncharacterised protein [Mycobacteroides abscessus subsp. bolletii]SHS02624.1 Uncharacterised protein [Mycobacteroides abscessus subsp. bolletii]
MTGECEVAEMVGAELQLEPVGSVCLSGGITLALLISRRPRAGLDPKLPVSRRSC